MVPSGMRCSHVALVLSASLLSSCGPSVTAPKTGTLRRWLKEPSPAPACYLAVLVPRYPVPGTEIAPVLTASKLHGAELQGAASPLRGLPTPASMYAER